MMTFPTCIIPIVPVFLVLLAIALWQRPPCTSRGRVFYLVTGMCGLWAGAVFLVLVFAHLSERTPSGATVYRPAALLERNTLTPLALGAACVGGGAWNIGRAVFGQAPSEEDDPERL